MSDAVRQRAAEDADFRAVVTAAAPRVLAMKAHRGLADC